jgi:3-oxoacyl-[acyl-carrier-protein] synthase-3
MLWNDVFVCGSGRFLPPRVDIASIREKSEVNKKAIELSGFQSFTASPNLTAPRMAARAASAALQHSERDIHDVAMLVYACFDEQDHVAPVCHVQRILGIPGALAFELGAGSNGGATGLVVAASHLRVDPSAVTTLVVAACRYLPPRWERWNPTLNVFMSDGAAAAVLSRDTGFARLVATSHTSATELERLGAPLTTTDGARERNPMLVESTGLEPYLTIIQEAVQTAVEQILREAEVKIKDVTKFVITALGLSQLSAIIFEPLGINADRSTWTFARELGHVGPCDQLLGLDHLIREGQLQQGDTILIIGIGLGFRFTCALLEITDSHGGPTMSIQGRA